MTQLKDDDHLAWRRVHATWDSQFSLILYELVDLPSESSRVGQRLLSVLFQYLDESVSKYLSFCSSRMTLLTSSCRWLPCWTATA